MNETEVCEGTRGWSLVQKQLPPLNSVPKTLGTARNCPNFQKLLPEMTLETVATGVPTKSPTQKNMNWTSVHIMICTLIAASLCACAGHAAHKDRAEQDKMTLSFDAFDQHYEVELPRELHKSPSNVKHTKAHPEFHGPLSTLKESCH